MTEQGRCVSSPRRFVTSKRALDLTIGLLLALLALPTILLAAAGSAIAFRAWPFFMQDRIGRDGERFRFVKIRTLPPVTDPYADKYSIDGLRLPRIARLLRRLHLDELPQLWLVVTGRMSLVGPRPEMPELHADMAPEFAAARTQVRPGCTGLWQISEGVTGLIHEHPDYDRYYLRHQNLRLDVWIMTRTIRVMLLGNRRIRLDEVPSWTTPRRQSMAAEPAPAVTS